MMSPLVDNLKKEDQSYVSANGEFSTDFFQTLLESSSSSAVQTISDSNFENIINSDSKGLKIVLFNAKWCSPGNAMERNLELSSTMEQNLLKNNKLNLIQPTEFYMVDTDYNPESCYKHNVRSIPCTLIFKNSEVIAEIVGTVPSSVIMEQITKHNSYVDSSSNNNNMDWNSQEFNYHSYQ
jgi:thioredoxin-like negative regulator of GroEL